MSSSLIRDIAASDNQIVGSIIRRVLADFGVSGTSGNTLGDASLDNLYEAYQKPRSSYLVIEMNGKVVGGAGIAPLEQFAGNVCELQKMYLLNDFRGMGLGSQLIKACLDRAGAIGFDQCYLETMPHMHSAIALYRKFGFAHIDKPMGNTGHYTCTVWMIRDLLSYGCSPH